MSNDYKVLYWETLSRKKIVLSRNFNLYDEALAFAKFKREENYDVLLVENLNEEFENCQKYRVHNFGYYKEYKFFNQTIYIILFLGLLFTFFYFKFKEF